MANKLVFMASLLILIILMTLQGYSGATKGGDDEYKCAACKHQRHRCSAECVFRPYFPASRPKDFENFHRLFRVKKTMGILMKLEQDERDEAAKSIIFQSNIRAQFPVGGCLQVISTLSNQIDLLNAELHHIRTQIANSIAAATYNPVATAVFNPPTTAFSSFSAEASSSGLRNPSTNLTDHFTGVPARHGTIDFFSGGGHCGNFGGRECVTETRPLERRTIVQQFLPNPNNLGSCPAAANYNENAIDSDFADEYEAFLLGNDDYQIQIQPNNDNELQPDDDSFDDLLRPFFQTKESGDKCPESKRKDDE